MDLNIGKKLDGRYEITELIGIGGMAHVYKAIDLMENKVVAVKILKTEFAESEEFLRRFRNESKAIAMSLLRQSYGNTGHRLKVLGLEQDARDFQRIDNIAGRKCK